MSQQADQSLLVTIEDCAALLSVGRTTVYGLIDDGALLRVKVGRRALITRRSVEQYVAVLRDEAKFGEWRGPDTEVDAE